MEKIDRGWFWICTNSDTITFEIVGLDMPLLEFIQFMRREWKHWYYSKVWKVPFVWRKGK